LRLESWGTEKKKVRECMDKENDISKKEEKARQKHR
jgi:hypothetical protein